MSDMHHESFKNVTAGIQSIATSVALIGGGLWAFWRFVINANKVDLDIGVNFVRKQGNNWIMLACYERRRSLERMGGL